jgi:hypothetical protein
MAASSLEHSLSSMQFGQKTATAYIASFFSFPGNHRRFFGILSQKSYVSFYFN